MPASEDGEEKWHLLTKEPEGSAPAKPVRFSAALADRDAASARDKAFAGAAARTTRGGTVVVVGDATVRAGDIVEVADLPGGAGGAFRVTRVTHDLVFDGGFQTEPRGRGLAHDDARARRAAVVRDALTEHRGTALGVVTGVFTNEGGSGDHALAANVRLRGSGLELQVVPVATGRLGLSCVPRVGDLAVVAFLDGDLNSAVVLGFLYDNQTLPPDAKADEIVYKVPEDEQAGVRRLAVLLPNGNEVRVEDKLVSVTMGKTSLKIEADGAVTLEAEGDLVLKAKGDVKIEATGAATLKGSSVTVEGDSSAAKLKGATTTIAGTTSFSVS